MSVARSCIAETSLTQFFSSLGYSLDWILFIVLIEDTPAETDIGFPAYVLAC